MKICFTAVDLQKHGESDSTYPLGHLLWELKIFSTFNFIVCDHMTCSL